jgi:hypothetical protein
MKMGVTAQFLCVFRGNEDQPGVLCTALCHNVAMSATGVVTVGAHSQANHFMATCLE